MLITHRIENDICILDLDGDLVLGTVNEAENYVTPIIEGKTFKAMVLNFEKLNEITSSGLGWITLIFQTLQKDKIPLAACALSERNKKLFHITGVDRVMTVFPTLQEALASF